MKQELKQIYGAYIYEEVFIWKMQIVKLTISSKFKQNSSLISRRPVAVEYNLTLISGYTPKSCAFWDEETSVRSFLAICRSTRLPKLLVN